MIDTLKTISLMIILGALTRLATNWLSSEYLLNFLDSNLVNLQVALLAINTTTAGVVLSRMRDIMDRTGANFDGTISSFRASATEQILLVICSLILLTAIHSSIIVNMHTQARLVMECFLISAFFASLYNLYDNARAIYLIIGFKIPD